MKLYDLIHQVEIQSETKYVYYDYDKCERFEITQEEALDKDIKYIYVDDGILYIEIDNED